MINSRIIPCLLLDGKGLVKTYKFRDPTYIGDPCNAIKIFNEKEVDELILLDIRATNNKSNPSFEFISEIASECFMPFSITPKKGYIGKGEMNKKKWIIKNKKSVIKNIQESISIFSKIHKKALIMDVIYQPEETLFLKFAKCYNLATLSGKQMNTMQAAYAFTKTFKKYNFSLDKIEKLMNKVK